MSLEEFRTLQARIDEHLAILDDLRRAAKDALCRHYGLVPGVTVLRSEGISGVFQEILNCRDGMPWVSVRTEKPTTERGGRGRHFYHAWEKVPDNLTEPT
jgi:hypothetical protein